MCQVRKVIWHLFAIWSTAEAAAGASDDTLVIVEKLIQPLGLFRKRTMAIKRFSQEYLTAQVQLHYPSWVELEARLQSKQGRVGL